MVIHIGALVLNGIWIHLIVTLISLVTSTQKTTTHNHTILILKKMIIAAVLVPIILTMNFQKALEIKVLNLYIIPMIILKY